jgi:hypothetical protein
MVFLALVDTYIVTHINGLAVVTLAVLTEVITVFIYLNLYPLHLCFVYHSIYRLLAVLTSCAISKATHCDVSFLLYVPYCFCILL